MANEPLALAIRPPDAPNEADFLTLCAALSQSARGRAFLAEYARRNRNADTEALLDAIGRIEDRLRADASAVQRLRDDLRMLLSAIRLARPEIDSAAPAAQAAKLGKLLDLLERRLDVMAGVTAAGASPLHLAVVPPPDEPELPIPSPAGASAPAIALVPSPAALPEVHRSRKRAGSAGRCRVGHRRAASDPLAAIMALSDDERLALFT